MSHSMTATINLPAGPITTTLTLDVGGGGDPDTLTITDGNHALDLNVVYDQADKTVSFGELATAMDAGQLQVVYLTQTSGEPVGSYLGLYRGVDLLAHVALPAAMAGGGGAASDVVLVDGSGKVVATLPGGVALYVVIDGAHVPVSVVAKLA